MCQNKKANDIKDSHMRDLTKRKRCSKTFKQQTPKRDAIKKSKTKKSSGQRSTLVTPMTVSKSENLSPNTGNKTRQNKRFDDQPLLHGFKTDSKIEKEPNLTITDLDESDSPMQMTYCQD